MFSWQNEAWVSFFFLLDFYTLFVNIAPWPSKIFLGSGKSFHFFIIIFIKFCSLRYGTFIYNSDTVVMFFLHVILNYTCCFLESAWCRMYLFNFRCRCYFYYIQRYSLGKFKSVLLWSVTWHFVIHNFLRCKFAIDWSLMPMCHC